ncbi:hypothetical protein JR316_0004088 [Psilocybe cubensis]|uniref:Uncharacterized protein n=2 Tax=Psilocybe cubensis TaxID=181762 RepID=A0ACB8H9R1_PSICU|nr:hypothetical protein JR316_0004088 [Psilocybe cubensis]KAH9484606.1 hypothetical protein JR316_0004088 [Psilocybe cubensis]
MSESSRSPTSIYVGAIIAVVALSTVGIILRVMAVRRMRMAALQPQNALASPLVYPQSSQGPSTLGRFSYYNPPTQPPRSYTGNSTQGWNNFPEPAPPYQPPSSPPLSPRINSSGSYPRTSTVFSPPEGPPPSQPSVPIIPPSFPVPNTSPPRTPQVPRAPQTPRTPQTPREPQAPSTHSYPQASSHPPSQEPTVPDPPQESSVPLTPADTGTSVHAMSLMDRMREVQSLMLQIHNLEKEPANSDNRAKIQALQSRVTELSDVSEAPPVPTSTTHVASDNPPRQPPPYALDGRDD